MSSALVDEMAIEEEFARVALKRATFRRILSYLYPFRRRCYTVMAVECVWVISMLLDPWFVKLAIDGPLAVGDVAGVGVHMGWMAMNLVFRVAITIWELRQITRIAVSALHNMRQEIFNHVQRLHMRYFDRTKQGRIIARADRDVDSLEHLLMWGPIFFTSLVACMIFGFIRLCWIDYRLLLWLLPAMPVMILMSRFFQHFAFPAYRRVREHHSAISAHVAESITGVRVIQAFGAEARELERLHGFQGLYRRAVLAGVRIGAAYPPALLTVFHGLLVACLVLGGYSVVAGEFGVGQLLEYVLLLGFVFGPIEGLGGLYNQCLSAGAAAERIFLLLDTEPEVRDRPGAVTPERIDGLVEFDHVGFSYDPSGANGRQLDDVSFTVPAGSTVALVGHTGAGKTSIVNLLSRFYEAQDGAVRIDGRDVRDFQIEGLHRRMGMVLQENFLFSGTVLHNLRFVKPDCTRDEARAGFAQLGVEEVLDRWPDGLDTDVGERGANLSEGERQIVCFVRALLSSPSILILDEATSAVDTRTERLILGALRKLAARQTTFVIAHRLSTIREADQILVMAHGKLVESGTHRELLAKDGTYAALYAEYGA
ncbi:MAG: ABC transporter ATP-binding protein [Planctomycetota bacterium]|jgi:ABC-type multidrug transport system fused ATPase/permease subunit